MFIAYLSALCTSPAHTATQFALLTALSSFGRTTLASITGFVAAATGWVVFFVLCAAAAIPGLLLLWLLTKRGDFTEIEAKSAPTAATRLSGRFEAEIISAAVVGPMQQSLALPRPAKNVATLAVTLDLPDVPAHRLPPLDLAQVLILHAAAQIIAAIPLEPAARVVGVNPTFLAPNGQRLARVDAEEVERSIASARRELSAGEPAFGKLISRVGQVLAPKHAEPQHLLGRQLGRELGIEIAADGGCQNVAIVPLHLVVHDDDALPQTLIAKVRET